jgi:hypothetical protein
MKDIMIVSPRRFETHIALRVGPVLAACLLLAGVSTAKANSIVLTENAYTYQGVNLAGGEFNAVTTPDSFLSSYATAAIINGGFETFCVETTVFFTPGVSYSYTLANQDSQGRALSKGAAYLYYEFGKGLLSDYNYLSTGSPSRNTDAGELTAAIWWFQGNQTGGSGFRTSGNITSDPFYTDAITALGGSTAAFDANNGFYGVEILQLTDASGHCKQNQLVLTPPTTVPETTSTLTLLGAALTTLGFAGRKLRSK